jgi:hypothetical protein
MSYNIMQKKNKQAKANEINEIEVNKILFLSSEILVRYEMILILFMEVNVSRVEFEYDIHSSLRWQKCVIIIHVHEARRNDW